MITHEFEWGEDDEMFLAIGDDPLCTSCDKPLSLHSEHVGITAEDEMITTYDDRFMDIYGSIRRDSDSW